MTAFFILKGGLALLILSNWYFVVSLLIGKRNADRWVKHIEVPLGTDDT